MKFVRWKRFNWDLSKLPTPAPPLAERYVLRAATIEDQKAVTHLILSAFTLDSEWGDAFALVRDWLTAQIVSAFEREAAPAVVITHGVRVIAASAISTEMDAETHLISGPCVSMEYRNRGLGTALLYQTLLQLRTAGLTHVCGIAKENLPAAKFVYPKFGAKVQEYDFDPALVKT
jgi:ribosomal protein S18 acetylase RimI-like enzyme